MRTLAWTTQLPSPSKSGRRSEILMTPSRSRAPWLPLPTGSSRALISGSFLVDSYVRFRLLGPWWQHRVRTVGIRVRYLWTALVDAPCPTVPQGTCTGARAATRTAWWTDIDSVSDPSRSSTSPYGVTPTPSRPPGPVRASDRPRGAHRATPTRPERAPRYGKPLSDRRVFRF